MSYTVTVVIYLLALIGVGAIKARKIKTQEDFSLAGRRLPLFVLVGTLLATWIGTGSIFGNAQETFRVGMPAFLIPFAGSAGIIALYLIASRIREAKHFTIQDILEERFGPWSRVIGTITLFMAYVIIVSYQYRAGAAIVERLMPDLGRTGAIVGVSLFVILYTVLAGMYSVAYTDVANGILMIIGITVAIPILLTQSGGWDGVTASLQGTQAAVFGHYSLGQILSILLPPFLLILGDANMYGRFFSAESPQAAKKSAFWMFFGTLYMECAIILVALLGLSLVNQGVLAAPENAGHIVVHLAFEVLPGILGPMLIATVVAVVVSTADSYLLAPASSLVRDVYQRFIKPDADEGTIVKMSRLTVVALGLVALGLAFTSDEFFYVSLFAYTLYGAAITPVLMAALFWKGATRQGAVAALLTGIISAILWQSMVASGMLAKSFAGSGLGNFFQTLADSNVDAVLPATLANILVLIVVSKLTKKA